MKHLSLLSLLGISLTIVSTQSFAASQNEHTALVTFTGFIHKPTAIYRVLESTDRTPSSHLVAGNSKSTISVTEHHGSNVAFNYNNETFTKNKNIQFSFNLIPIEKSENKFNDKTAYIKGLTITHITLSGRSVKLPSDSRVNLENVNDNLKISMHKQQYNHNSFKYDVVLSKINTLQPAKVSKLSLGVNYVVTYN